MYDSINPLKGEIPLTFKEVPNMVFKWLMCCSMEGVDASDLQDLWMISGTAVPNMYFKAMRIGNKLVNNSLSRPRNNVFDLT